MCVFLSSPCYLLVLPILFIRVNISKSDENIWKPFIDNIGPIFWFSVIMWQGAVLLAQELGMLSTLAFLPHSPKSGTAAPQTWHDDYDDDDDVHLIIYC